VRGTLDLSPLQESRRQEEPRQVTRQHQHPKQSPVSLEAQTDQIQALEARNGRPMMILRMTKTTKVTEKNSEKIHLSLMEL
jgi:hypothetical protein